MTDLEDYKSLHVVIHKNKQCEPHWLKNLRKYAHRAEPLFEVFTSKALLRWTLFEMHINARDWELRIPIPKVDVDKGMKSLGQLCREGELDLVRAVLERTQARLDDRVRCDGATPLFFAAANGHLEVVRYLCEAGANTDAARDDGATPLWMAAGKGHLEVVRYLCEAGGNADVAADGGVTPLCMAAQEGHLEVVRCLCKAGASESAVPNSGETAIDAASRSGHDNIANFLKKRNAYTKPAGRD
jgi:ankyrin repeat protein